MNAIKLPSGVGFTAIQVAAERERESSRPDALFTDPLAMALVAQVKSDGGQDGPAPYLSSAAQWLYGGSAALRTHFIDEKILSAVRDLSQIVIIAAGLDGRGYRLGWPVGARVFELERAEVLDFKQQVVQRAKLVPTVELVPVAGDISQDWQQLLRAAGFAAELPTLWLVEGILNYLEPDAADRLIAQVSAVSAPSSRLLAVYAVGDLTAVAARAGRDGDADVATLNKLWKAGPSIEPGAWLPGHGWQVETTTISAWAERLGRPIPPAMDPKLDGAPYYFVNARRP